MPRGSSPMQAALVRADRVEVAQQRDRATAGRRRRDRAGCVSPISLVCAVRVGRRQRRVLGDRQRCGLAVDGGAGAEHERAGKPCARIASQQRQQAADVVGVVGERALRRSRRPPCSAAKCTTASMRPAGEHRIERRLRRRRRRARSPGAAPDSVCRRFSTSGELFEKSSTPTTSKPAALQREPGVRRDVAGGAGQQDGAAAVVGQCQRCTLGRAARRRGRVSGSVTFEAAARGSSRATQCSRSATVRVDVVAAPSDAERGLRRALRPRRDAAAIAIRPASAACSAGSRVELRSWRSAS